MTSQNVQSVFAYGIDQQGGKGNANYTEDVAPTILSDSHGTPHGVAYGISPFCSKGMLSDNPNVGFYKAETSRTLDLNGGSPACNQGGIAVVFSLEGNGQRESHRGDGWKESDVSYTLNTTEQHGVYACDVYNQTIEGDIAPTVTAAAGGTNTSGPKILEQRKEENENV